MTGAHSDQRVAHAQNSVSIAALRRPTGSNPARKIAIDFEDAHPADVTFALP